MESGIGILLLVVLSSVGLLALFASLLALFPKIVRRSKEAAERTPGRAFMLGLVNFLFLAAIGLGFGALSNGLDTEFFLFPALLIAAALTIGITLGLAGMAYLVGERLYPDHDQRKQILWGSFWVILASLTPFLGWFLLFPYLAITGLGAFILRWFQARNLDAADEEFAPDPGL